MTLRIEKEKKSVYIYITILIGTKEANTIVFAQKQTHTSFPTNTSLSTNRR